jgi:hypothetical protein
VTTPWEEISRVLARGGLVVSQQVGAGSNRELIDFMMGPQLVHQARNATRHVRLATAAGLRVTNLQQETLAVAFYDVGAIVYFLRKVLWTVPDFSVERYRSRLAAMHEQISREGKFVCHSERFLIEATLP